LVAIGCVSVGCAGAPKRIHPVPAAQDGAENRPFLAPIRSESDNWHDEAVVRIVGSVSCTGTLIAEDLVLTAHHCVSKRDGRGRVMREDVDAETLQVELGGDDLPFGEVGVRAIVAPECGYEQGEGDIAILVLSRRVVGMPAWAPRLDGPPRVGEVADTLGYGRCASNTGLIRRQARGGARIASVSQGQSTAVASICPGDSGGPVFDSTNNTSREIIGVVSASVMDATDATKGMSYFTRVYVWPQLFIAAREIADGQSAAELPPFRSCHRGPVPGAD
jgi:secreted trypsin-like serine protease